MYFSFLHFIIFTFSMSSGSGGVLILQGATIKGNNCYY